jgi:hypothetical protein
MNIDQQELRIQDLEKTVKQLTNVLSSILQNSSATKVYFKNQVQFDGQGQIGFFGKDPIKKPAAITAPSGGATVDTQARTAISTIITTLQNLGLTS